MVSHWCVRPLDQSFSIEIPRKIDTFCAGFGEEYNIAYLFHTWFVSPQTIYKKTK